MRSVEGDLLMLALAGEFDVIVHGCNCWHSMGTGIAKSIRERFPEAFEADLRTPRGDKSKLGTTSSVMINRGKQNLIVVNGYTQFDWHRTGVHADYESIFSVMHSVKREFGGLRIGYPQIGAELEGADWRVISGLIDAALTGEDHTVVIHPSL